MAKRPTNALGRGLGDLSGMGQARKKQRQGYASRADLEQVLQTEYGLTPTDLMSLRELTTDAMLPALQAEVKELKEKIEKFKPRGVRAYVVQCLRNFLRQLATQMPVEEEVDDADIVEDIKPSKPLLTEDDLNMWNLFLQMVQDTITEDQYFKWFSETNIYSFENNCLTMTVPTRFVMEYIEQNLLPQVKDALEAAFGDGCNLRYRLAD